MNKYVLITGSSGAIGQALMKNFKENGYIVCATDTVQKDNKHIDFFIQQDLNILVNEKKIQADFFNKINKYLDENHLNVIINNAAYQHVSTQHPIETKEFQKSYNINVIAPYLITSNLANKIQPKFGSVINIGSIHAKLTKPGFTAYSTTKAALAALTKGLAIDYQDQFRINCIEPASVETPMLLDGFRNSPEKINNLKNFHPQKRISTPEEIAELALLISSEKIRFLHGATIDMSGGLAGRLHDPV